MQFRVDEGDMRKALSFVGMFLDPRTTIEATRGIRITAGEHVILEATDLSKSCRVRIPATIEQQGECVVSGEQFIRAVQHQQRGDNLLFSTKRSHLHVNNQKGFVSKIGTLNPVEFPAIPLPPSGEPARVRRDELLELLRRVKPGADQTRKVERPFASSIFFTNGVVFATDGMKAAVVRSIDEAFMPMEMPFDADKYFDAMGDTISIRTAPHQLFAWDDEIYFTINLQLNSAPPDINRVLSTQQEQQLTVALDAESVTRLKEALRRARIFSRIATLFFQGDRLYVIGIGDNGESVNVVDVPVSYTGADTITVSYNADFFMSLLPNGEDTTMIVTTHATLLIETGDYTGLLARAMSGHEQHAPSLAAEVSA